MRQRENEAFHQSCISSLYGYRNAERLSLDTDSQMNKECYIPRPSW